MTLRSSLALLLLTVVLGGCAAPGALGRDAAALRALRTDQLLEIAAVLEQNGDSVRAEQYLQQALRQGAPPARVLPHLLRLYVADGQYRLALELAENHLRKRPRDRSLRLFLASLYMALGDETQAVTHYRQVLSEQPGNAQAHFALASALHQGGHDLDHADRHFRAYLELEPHGPHAEEARSLLLTQVVDSPARPQAVDAPQPLPMRDPALPVRLEAVP